MTLEVAIYFFYAHNILASLLVGSAMVEYDIVKRGLEALIEKFQQLEFEVGEKGLKELGEANVRKDFIDPLFRALGWKTDDSREYDAESYVRGVGHADVALKIGLKPVIFVEAKKFGGVPSRLERGVQLTLAGQKIYADWTAEERQVLNYAGMSVDVKWAILTNFEKFRLFNAKTGDIVLNIESTHEYLERIDDLMLLTRDQIEIGNIDKLERRVERPDVDLNFLNSLNDWRLKLARNIHKNLPHLSLKELKANVQRILDRFVVIRYAEDKWVLKDPDQLHAAFEYWSKTRTYTSLTEVIRQLFLGFNQIHDSKIFEEDKELDTILGRIDNEVLASIIQALYGQNFRKFTSDILGNTYESYLGHQLYSKNGKLEIKLTPGLRKAGGIYYTEPPVVDYIVANTLGRRTESRFQGAVRLLETNNIEDSHLKFSEIAQIRVLDPACGSGSFLIRAFNHLKQIYEAYNGEIEEENQRLTNRILQLRKTGKNMEAWKLEAIRPQRIEDFEIKILRDNIFGVDLDSSAAEIASVNLMLQGLKRGEKLPLILEENIKVGNSIIDSDEAELQKFFGKQYPEMSPFAWKKEFKNILGEGFDVVLGNPPYFTIATQSTILKRYLQKSSEWSDVYRGQNDILFYFIMRGLQLLKDGGLLGFIVARYWLESKWADKLRSYILRNAKIRIILDSGNMQFFKGANVLTSIIILEKDSNSDSRLKNIIKFIKVTKWDKSHARLFQHIMAHQKESEYQDDSISIFSVAQRLLCDQPWTFAPPTIEKLKEKIRRGSWLLGEICDIGQGMKTGLNEVFILTPEEVTKYHLEENVLKKYVKTRDIKRYHIKYRNLYLVYTVPELEPSDIPNTINYLKSYRTKLEERYQFKDGVCSWFGLSIPQNRGLFDGVDEKILVPNYSTSNKFAHDNRSFYTLTDTYVIVAKQKIVSLKYVLGILNSRLMNFFYRYVSKLKRDGYMEYFTRPLSEIPIKKIDMKIPEEKNAHNKIAEDVDKIIELIEKRGALETDFDRYICEPVIYYTKFRSIFNELSASEREADNTTKGKIEKIRVIEEGDFLRFLVNYSTNNNEGREVADYTVIRCRIANEALRKFILFYVNQKWKSLGTGNLLSKLLAGMIPLFKKNKSENLKIMEKITSEYSKTLKIIANLDAQIAKTNSSLDSKIYDLYGLNNEERKLIESEIPESALIPETD